VFELYSQLPRNQKELQRHIAALTAMTTAREHQALFDHLYECLSILDAKSASLLSFNSIIIAVFAIFLASEPRGFSWAVLNFGVAVILISCLLLLIVVWVHWSTTAQLQSREDHAIILLQVRSDRTFKYGLAWYFSVAGMVALSLFLISRIIGTLVHRSS
jgi:hypothetical protein